MWARVCEIAVGLWLISSGWVLPPGGVTPLPLAAGAASVMLSIANWRRPRGATHLWILPIAAGLLIHGWLATRGPGADPAVAQNEIVTGLLLATFAIIPSEAARPPVGWRRDHDAAVD